MIVQVALYAGLSQYLPPGTQDRRTALELPEGSAVHDALARLGIPADVSRILVLDGKVTTEDTVLRAGQTLGVFPPLAGGSPLSPAVRKYEDVLRPLVLNPQCSRATFANKAG